MSFFAWRGAIGSQSRSSDLFIIYGGTCAFVDGFNPYNSDDVDKAIKTRNFKKDMPQRDIISLYPPSTYFLMSPMALFDWATARAFWLLIQLVSVAIIIIGLLAWSDTKINVKFTFALVVFTVLCFAPVQTGIRLGQLALPVMALVVIGNLFTIQGKFILAIFCFAVGVSLKPQLAFGLACVPLLIGRGKITLLSGALCLVLLGQSLIILSINGYGLDSTDSWLEGLKENIKIFSNSGDGSVGKSNLKRHELLNLSYPISLVTGGMPIDKWLGFFVPLLITMGIFLKKYSIWFSCKSTSLVEITSDLRRYVVLISISTLMITYHRSYDAVLLLFILPLLLDSIFSYRIKIILSILMALFLLPTPSILYTLELDGFIDLSFLSDWFKNGILLANQAWALVFMCLLVLFFDRKEVLK